MPGIHERSVDDLLAEAVAFHGHLCPGQVLGVRMVQAGCREAGIVAHECPQGRLHVNAESVLVEVVDGAVVLTTLDNFAMPLVRYRNEDLAEPLAGPRLFIRQPRFDPQSNAAHEFLRRLDEIERICPIAVGGQVADHCRLVRRQVLL